MSDEDPGEGPAISMSTGLAASSRSMVSSIIPKAKTLSISRFPFVSQLSFQRSCTAAAERNGNGVVACPNAMETSPKPVEAFPMGMAAFKMSSNRL